MCCVDLSVVVMVIYLLSDSTIPEKTQKCGFFLKSQYPQLCFGHSR